MKAFRELAVLLITNASIGIVAIVSIVGFFVCGLYLIEVIEKLFISVTSPSFRLVLSIGISSILALNLLAIFGIWVREKIEDVVLEIRSRRNLTK